MSRSTRLTPDSFTQPMNKVAGVYFSVTVLATVGFGDISPVTDTARILVTVQMVLDLVLIGAAVKLLGASARRAVDARLGARARLRRAPSGRPRCRPPRLPCPSRWIRTWKDECEQLLVVQVGRGHGPWPSAPP